MRTLRLIYDGPGLIGKDDQGLFAWHNFIALDQTGAKLGELCLCKSQHGSDIPLGPDDGGWWNGTVEELDSLRNEAHRLAEEYGGFKGCHDFHRPNLNIYKISQPDNGSYDIFDAAIVAAPDDETARRINPGADKHMPPSIDTWCEPEFVRVELLGRALPGIKTGVILGSFNAG